jgi:hypothetical protein|tara:strand:+ start:120 stop:362 length:243 start_codon:yes stop_codon:yes gene_type:complete
MKTEKLYLIAMKTSNGKIAEYISTSDYSKHLDDHYNCIQLKELDFEWESPFTEEELAAKFDALEITEVDRLKARLKELGE